MTLEAVTPEGWKRGRGYSHAIKTADRILVAGVLPWDPTTQEVQGANFAEQWALALKNFAEVLNAGGADPSDVTCLRVFVTSFDAYRSAASSLAEGWKPVFGNHFPAITMVEVAALIEPDAMIEIEGEAVIQGTR